MKTFLMIAAPLALAVPAAVHAQPPVQDGGRMFAMIDANGDGKLDKAEITKMMQMRAERMGDPSFASPERVAAFIKHVDTNGDGVIDKAEFDAMRKARAAAPPPPEPEQAPSND